MQVKLCAFRGDKWGMLKSFHGVPNFENAVWEMFEGDFADTCGDKFSLAFIGVKRICQAYEDKGGSRTPLP